MKLDMCTECGMNAPSCYSIVERVPARCCSNCTHADAQELYAELLPLRSREPLVQAVIDAANAPVESIWADRVVLAARRLAEWKP